MITAWIGLLMGCATLRDTAYGLEMTHREGVIFIGYSCWKPADWTGDQSSKDAIRSKVQRAIDAELTKIGYPHMTIYVHNPASYELSASKLEGLAYAGEMPMDELNVAANKIINDDPLGKHKPKPFYQVKGEFSD